MNVSLPFQHFFEGVKARVAQGVKEEEVSFQLAYSKQELRKVIEKYPGKEVKRALENLYRKIHKYLSPEENLLPVTGVRSGCNTTRLCRVQDCKVCIDVKGWWRELMVCFSAGGVACYGAGVHTSVPGVWGSDPALLHGVRDCHGIHHGGLAELLQLYHSVQYVEATLSGRWEQLGTLVCSYTFKELNSKPFPSWSLTYGASILNLMLKCLYLVSLELGLPWRNGVLRPKPRLPRSNKPLCS